MSSKVRSAKERARRHTQQSPHQHPDHKKAHEEQVSRFNLKSGDAGDQFFTPQKGDHIHHLRQGRTVDALFANTNSKQTAQLVKEIGSVNSIANLMPVPGKAHIGAKTSIHSRLLDKGLTPQAKAEKQHPLIKEIEASANAPFRKKIALARRYKRELKPLIDAETNDALTDYYTSSQLPIV